MTAHFTRLAIVVHGMPCLRCHLVCCMPALPLTDVQVLPLHNPAVPRQPNHVDCGVYASINIEEFVAANPAAINMTALQAAVHGNTGELA